MGRKTRKVNIVKKETIEPVKKILPINSGIEPNKKCPRCSTNSLTYSARKAYFCVSCLNEFSLNEIGG